MATIKSYTDLQQSKKLADILPIESADMYYCYSMDINTKKWEYDTTPTIIDASNQIDIGDIPCWSLAALLEILPAECECMSLEHINYGNNHKKYFMSYIGGENTEDYDNPVDACYEMIIKLNELNML